MPEPTKHKNTMMRRSTPPMPFFKPDQSHGAVIPRQDTSNTSVHSAIQMAVEENAARAKRFESESDARLDAAIRGAVDSTVRDVLIVLALILAAFALGLFLGHQSGSKETIKPQQIEVSK